MRCSLRSKIASHYLNNRELAEVVDIFEHLFDSAQPDYLPKRVVVTDVYPNADFRDLRDNVPQWEDECLPKDQRLTYEEIQEIEGNDLLFALSTVDRDSLSAPFESQGMCETLAMELPSLLRPFAHWILGDFRVLLRKRFVLGAKPGILEDILQTYRAGYLVYGWTGSYPNDIRLLAFPAVANDIKQGTE